MNDGAMTNRDVFFQNRRFSRVSVKNCPILNIGAFANHNCFHITS
jgi:hypothetical protein